MKSYKKNLDEWEIEVKRYMKKNENSAYKTIAWTVKSGIVLTIKLMGLIMYFGALELMREFCRKIRSNLRITSEKMKYQVFDCDFNFKNGN